MPPRPTTIAGVRTALAKLRTPEGLERALAFETVPTDVFVASYPKSGTTWMQQIAHGLRTGGDMSFDEISRVVPWLELAWDLHLDPSQSPWTPRVLKTHFTRQEVPKGARYIYMVRDPKDVLISFFHFFDGWLFETGAIDLATFAEQFFFEGSSSGNYWHHVASWWNARDQHDTLFVCFEDLKADLPGVVADVARFIGAEAHVDIAVAQATFAFMRAHPTKFDEHLIREERDPVCGIPAGLTEKLRAGRVGDSALLPSSIHAALDRLWADQMGPLGFEDYAALRAAMAAARSAAL